MGCCDFSKAELDEESLLDETEGREDPIPASTAHVSLAPDAGGSRVNSVDIPPPEVYYVIVGRGPGAVMNHTTLRGSQWGRDRIGDLPVMHIGFNNPWPHYVAHGMGQVPFLLTMPGFHAQPNAAHPPAAAPRTLDGGLHSTDFGNAIDAQYAHLMQANPFEERRAWVAWVQHRDNPQALPDIRRYYPENGPYVAGLPVTLTTIPAPAPDGGWLLNGPGTQLHQMIVNHVAQANARNDWPDANDRPDAHYRLILIGLNHQRQPQLQSIYAAYIDLCTGPGRPNVVVPANATNATKQALHAARTHPWLPSEVWNHPLRTRRVLNGVDAIANQVAWAMGERVCVTAGGGVGLNVAEKARNHNSYLDWFGRNSLIATFANPRNHTFLLSPNNPGQAMAVGELDQVAPFHQHRDIFVPKPPVRTQRFGFGATLENAELAANQVRVTLAGANAQLIDHHQALLAPPPPPPHLPPPVPPPGPLGLVPALVPNPNPNNPPGSVWDCGPLYLNPPGVPPPPNHPDAANWPSALYDRLVVPNGQVSTALGQPAWFTEIQQPVAPEAVNGRMVALQSADGRVRMLGAACQVYPDFGLGGWDWQQPAFVPTPADQALWDHWHYHSTLPVSAVPDGFILSGSNIATANRYFVDHPNNNINTMTRAEIHAALTAAGLPAPLALHIAEITDAIVGCRNRANGYPSYLDQPAQLGPHPQPGRGGLMTIVNLGQPYLEPVANQLAGPNDAEVVGLTNLGFPLTLAHQALFLATFRFDYP